MIASSKVAQIEGLLAEGRHSQRAIARIVGVARGTVAGIARGTRPDYDAIRQAREEQQAAPFDGPAERCPGCGAMVQMPCLRCALEARQAIGGSTTDSNDRPSEGIELGLALRPQHQERYEKIRARRERLRERLAARDTSRPPRAAADHHAVGTTVSKQTTNPHESGSTSLRRTPDHLRHRTSRPGNDGPSALVDKRFAAKVFRVVAAHAQPIGGNSNSPT